jgi:hypothetical protein
MITPPSVLTVYLQTSDDWVLGTFKFDTLSGPIALLTGQERKPWIYQGVPVSDASAEMSNVVSGVWQLCSDFGVVGCGLALALLGYLSTSLYAGFSRKPSVAKGALLVSLYVLIFWLPVACETYYVYWHVLAIFGPIIGGTLYVAKLGDKRAGKSRHDATGSAPLEREFSYSK